jgi:hypothetical protein
MSANCDDRSRPGTDSGGWSQADELRRRDLIGLATLQTSVAIVFAAATLALLVDVLFVQVVLGVLCGVATGATVVAASAFWHSPMKHDVDTALQRHGWVVGWLMATVVTLYAAAIAILIYEIR